MDSHFHGNDRTHTSPNIYEMRVELSKEKMEFKNMQEAVLVCGRHDENVRLIERELGVAIISRDNEIVIEGEPKA